MRRLILIMSLAISWPLASHAQIVAPNQTGVAMGRLNTIVRNVEATKKFWITLGAAPITVDGTEVMKFPGVLVFLTPGTPVGGSTESIASHVGLYVPSAKDSFEKWKAAGLRVDGGFIYTPDDLKMDIHDYSELKDIAADDLRISLVGDKPIDLPIAGTHIHFFIGESSQKEMQTWYVNMFGGTAGKTVNGARVGGIPGVSISVGRAPNERMGAISSPVPTKGRALDAIGFEVKNLDAFCKKLAASGTKFDQPYSKTRHKSFASARLTDPWGTSIELTEGLRKF
jgi:hypothetical protein